ncbi:DUF1631 family protein [Hydrogenophaga sp. 5NK40-0174]|uniref:DUF1631 family protein n=1 Tax=Hydrogenophaga sp. 5NK40-0174 TaxID=3127649 RepID=UPI00310B97CB
MALPTDQHVSSLAKQAREHFVVHVGRGLPDLVKVVSAKLSELIDMPGSAPEVQERRDAWMAFQKQQNDWLAKSRKALQRTLLPQRSAGGARNSAPGRLELLAEGAMDDQIMASRLAMKVLDLASSELNDLRLRVQHLENRQELARDDVLLPDVVTRLLVDQWLDCDMSREAWQLVQDTIADFLSRHLLTSYKKANEFLVASGVMKEINLQDMVRRKAGSGQPASPRDQAKRTDEVASGRGEQSVMGSSTRGSGGTSYNAGSRRSGAQSPANLGGTDVGVHEETRLMTSASPLARAKMRAQGVVGRLRRFLADKVGDDFEATQLLPTSPRLQQAIQRAKPVVSTSTSALGGASGSAPMVIGTQQVKQASEALRERTRDLKEAAETHSEKAIVEVVALMFQSILAEERIPPSVRVWFARLQIPVLRVALAEPEFFSALQHPARRLIDRMGACVMGFESDIASEALEAEIKRIVQVIEQYPETGRRVFQLVYDEFQKFLSTYLSEKTPAKKFVSVAQQIEQKETLSVQYTIELRKLLDDMPVRDEVRDFLFHVWVDVLAVASVKHGLKHEETQSLKQVASELLWAASAKPDRNDRARVIQQLPNVLQRMRHGMGLLGLPPSVQDGHIKRISDTLAEAFMSRTDPIPQESLDHLAERLSNLEEFLPESGVGDLDLDNDSIEMITGVDASNIEVINQGGSQPNAAMRAWAAELQIGSWFSLDHNSRLNSVQLAWRSERGQLYMFVTNSGRCYLVQATRVASYLQAGLLLPSEEETLTVRATRDAMAKLEANPERLFD